MKKENHIKKLTLIVAVVMAVATALMLVPVKSRSVLAVEDYKVTGGRLVYDFEDGKLTDFDLYTEFDKLPYTMDGKLYFWVLAEQKAILKKRSYSDVEVNVDIMTINKSGKFDSGIYVQASEVGPGMDEINAWCVNLERSASETTYYLKLHRFNNSYLGARVEVGGLKLPMDKVHLRVIVKNGILYAFVDYQETPTITYYIGTDEGKVGLRNFYSPNYFDNFTVIGEGNSYDYSELFPAIEKAREYNTDELTEESGNRLKTALDHAVAVLQTTVTQYEIDELAKTLNDAIESVIYKRAFSELVSVLSQAEAIINEDGKVYTKNSWSSLQKVITVCSQLTEDSDEQLISYWTNRLEYRISALIPYLTEVNQ